MKLQLAGDPLAVPAGPDGSYGRCDKRDWWAFLCLVGALYSVRADSRDRRECCSLPFAPNQQPRPMHFILLLPVLSPNLFSCHPPSFSNLSRAHTSTLTTQSIVAAVCSFISSSSQPHVVLKKNVVPALGISCLNTHSSNSNPSFSFAEAFVCSLRVHPHPNGLITKKVLTTCLQASCITPFHYYPL